MDREGRVRKAAGQARRSGEKGQAQLCPQEEGLSVLRRQGRLHRLQEGRSSYVLHPGTRQDSSAPHDGDLRAASALADRRDQAGAEYRAAAFRRRAVTSVVGKRLSPGFASAIWSCFEFNEIVKKQRTESCRSFFKKMSKSWEPRRIGGSSRRLCAQFSPAAQAGPGSHLRQHEAP